MDYDYIQHCVIIQKQSKDNKYTWNWTASKTLDLTSAIKYHCKIQTMNYNDNMMAQE